MTQVGSVYGEALYDLAKSEGLSDTILQELSVLEESFRQSPDFLRLLAAQSITKQERCAILDDSFRDKLHLYVLNFLKILTEKGYSKHFFDCAYSGQSDYLACLVGVGVFETFDFLLVHFHLMQGFLSAVA